MLMKELGLMPESHDFGKNTNDIEKERDNKEQSRKSKRKHHSSSKLR